MKSFANFKRNSRDLEGGERDRFLHRDFDLHQPRSLVFDLAPGHIGDMVIAFEAILGMRAFLDSRSPAKFEFLPSWKREKAKFFERFLRLVPVFDSDSDSYSHARHKRLRMNTLHADFKAEFVSMGTHWDFYWAQWGLPGKFRPAQVPLEQFRREARAGFGRVCGELGLPAQPEFVIFFPESSPTDGTHKLWPMRHWLELIFGVLERTDRSVVVCTHRREFLELAKHEPRVVVFDPENTPVRADFFNLAMLVENADAVVAVDTGPAHVAGFLGRPCITLFGPTQPNIEGHRGNLNLRVSSCPPCGWQTASQFCRDNVCMKEIRPCDVLKLLTDALGGRYEPR